MDDETPRYEKSIGEIVDSLELVSARLVETVSRTAQLASSTTPEMQSIFNEWLAIVSDQIRGCIGDDGDIDVSDVAHRIGIEESTVFSLLLALHRNGKIRIERMKAVVTDTRDTEICGCLLKGGESHFH